MNLACVKVFAVLPFLVCLVLAQTPAPTGTTVTGFFRPLGAALSQAISAGNRTVQMVASTANQTGQGVIQAKQTLANTGIALLSNGMDLATGIARDFASIGNNLAASVRLPGVASLAAVGARLVETGANLMNAGGQMGLSVLQGVVNSKNQLASSGISAGAGVASSLSSSAASAGVGAVNAGVNVAEGMASAAGNMMASGVAMMEQGMQMVQSAVDRANQMAQTAALNAQTSINSAMNTGATTAAAAAANAAEAATPAGAAGTTDAAAAATPAS